MKDQNYLFSIDLKVRDYECDLQGVVNNANYQHYMEHTRHEFLESLGENLSALNCYKKGAKLIFDQYILFPDGTVSAQGEIETVAVQNGVITRGEVFDKLLEGIDSNR